MEAVAELVEDGGEFVEGQQRRFGSRRLGEVGHQRNEGTLLLAVHESLLAERGHPRAAAFALAREVVDIEHRHEAAVLVGHVEGLYIRVINRNFRILGELQAVETVRQVEDGSLHAAQFEVGLEQFFVDGVFLVAVLLAPVGEIPRHQLLLKTVAGCIFLDVSHVAQRGGVRLCAEVVQEGEHLLRGLGHAVFDGIICISLVTQQVRAPEAEIQDLVDVFQVVELATHALGVVGRPELATQLAVLAITEEGAEARIVERVNPAFQAACGRLFGTHVTHILRQAGKVRLVGDMQRVGVGRGEHVLAELQGGHGEFFLQLGVDLLVLVGKVGTAAGELFVGFFEQFGLFGGQIQAFPAVVDGLDALKELRVEHDGHGELGQQRGNLLGQVLHLVVGAGLVEIEEDVADAGHGFARVGQGFDGVGEGRSLGIVHDGLNLCLAFFNSLKESGFVVFRLDFVKRGRAVRSVGRNQQRIVHGTGCKGRSRKKGRQNRLFHTAKLAIFLIFAIPINTYTLCGLLLFLF